MLLPKLKQLARSHIPNMRGWHTDRKIVVIESDDWGAIRMSSKNTLRLLADAGIQVHKCHYMENDALASETDLTQLFELLAKYRDSNGNHPVITANVIMANPDFNKIRNADFKEYYYEVFTETLKRFPEHSKSFELWKNGIEHGLFHPQFHGREHIQVKRWLSFLQNADTETRKAFNAGVFGVSTTATTENRKSYLAAYDWDDGVSREFVLTAVADGIALFEKIFGFKPLSAIAPNYIWHSDIEQQLNTSGVKYLQGNSVQRIPATDNTVWGKKRHYTGQKNEFGQTYLVRNCSFEPSSQPNLDWVGRCLQDIKNAFLWKKPAIISIHRVNFIGYINPDNRSKNLYDINRLLNRITKEWPEVEFMTSDQLGQLIDSDE